MLYANLIFKSEGSHVYAENSQTPYLSERPHLAGFKSQYNSLALLSAKTTQERAPKTPKSLNRFTAPLLTPRSLHFDAI